MRRMVLSAATCAATMGVALAQVGASSSTYLIDVDPALYSGPAGQRVALRVGDQPRNVVIGAQDKTEAPAVHLPQGKRTLATGFETLGRLCIERP